jgi:archaellum component FlaG (FlaF/FlaG flagellin family)
MKIGGFFNLLGLNDTKTDKKKEEEGFKDNDKVTISGTPADENLMAMKKLSQMKEAYSKEDALFTLMDVNPKEAGNNLKVVEGHLKPGESLKEATAELIQIIKAENDVNQARQNYEIIDKYITPDNSRQELTEQFVIFLKQRGPDSTTETQNDFKMIGDTLKKGEKIKDAVDSFMALDKAENDRDQARQNYKLLDKFVSQDKPRTLLAEEFNRVLNAKGADSTAESQSAFEAVMKSLKSDEKLDKAVDIFAGLGHTASSTKELTASYNTIDASLKPGETREDVAKEFVKIANAENDPAQARQNHDIVTKYISKDNSRQELTEQLVRFLKQRGADSTTETQNDFKMIADTLKKGEKMEDAVDSFMALDKSENDRNQARDNYRLVNEYVSDSKPRTDLTEQFNKILNKLGNDETTKAREMFKQLNQ